MESLSTNSKLAGLRGLDAYRVAIEMYREIDRLLQGKPRVRGVVQLIDAAESVIRNIGEAYPALGADRARRFRIAADEASECGAALDILEIRGLVDTNATRTARELLDRVNAMLWRLSRK
jgi:four helix bundle protein